jgi:hypothetical protein
MPRFHSYALALASRRATALTLMSLSLAIALVLFCQGPTAKPRRRFPDDEVDWSKVHVRAPRDVLLKDWLANPPDETVRVTVWCQLEEGNDPAYQAVRLSQPDQSVRAWFRRDWCAAAATYQALAGGPQAVMLLVRPFRDQEPLVTAYLRTLTPQERAVWK